jgi:purine-binding chemotaxis protein CheW
MVLPVFDLRKRLGLEAQPYTRDTRIIVVMVDSRHCGLIVDRVKQVVRIPEDSLEEPPAILGRVAEGPGGEAEFLEGIGRFDHQMLIILNLVKVLEISHQAQAVGNKIPEKGRLT